MRFFFFGLVFVILGTVSVFWWRANRTTSDAISTSVPSLAELFQSQPSPTSEPVITILFTGDVMLDRNIRLKGEQIGYKNLVGPRLKEKMNVADLAVINLEGPVTTEQSVSVGSAVGSTRNFIFTFSPESLEVLKDSNIKIVNLGNNHILNFGPEGLSATYQHLDQAGIKYFGYTGSSQPQGSRTYILNHEAGRIGFVNYNQFLPNGEAAAFEDIEALVSQVEYLVVYTHWGNEYVPENQVLISLAHQFVDAGADLVIGSHPHVVTGNELYQNTHIFYSLGNFIFDQYFDAEVKKGQLVTAKINPKTQETQIETDYVSIQNTGVTELETSD